ncbi:hypothetical protein SS50377_20017 [Spironucleus salmonicida]|uniref:Uncharacterized protein n=1 Tax=Spironucleus salmonicida TaxID=348837 RepID=A0A9P8LYM5_9EUKA|nr:hypothetical protein SS50377_20017 [Spironucleus salmonicida]
MQIRLIEYIPICFYWGIVQCGRWGSLPCHQRQLFVRALILPQLLLARNQLLEDASQLTYRTQYFTSACQPSISIIIYILWAQPIQAQCQSVNSIYSAFSKLHYIFMHYILYTYFIFESTVVYLCMPHCQQEPEAAAQAS